MLSNISYRYKIPASLSLVIVVTALAVAVPLISGANETDQARPRRPRAVARQDAGGCAAAGAAARRHVAGVRDHHHAVRSRAPAAARSTDDRGRGRSGRDLRRERPQAISGDAAAGEPRADGRQIGGDHHTAERRADGAGGPRSEAVDHGRARALQRQHAARHGDTRVFARHLSAARSWRRFARSRLRRPSRSRFWCRWAGCGASRSRARCCGCPRRFGRSRERLPRRLRSRRRQARTKSRSSAPRSTTWSTAFERGRRSRKKSWRPSASRRSAGSPRASRMRSTTRSAAC